MLSVSTPSIVFSEGEIAQRLSKDVAGLSVYDPVDVKELERIIKLCKFSPALLDLDISAENLPVKLTKSI